MGKPKAPAAPDPAKTAAAQTGTNVTTALANAQLGNVNQYSPDGSITYRQNGGTSFTDPTSGATYWIPQYEQITSLSPQQQAIKEQNDGASLNLASLGNTLSGKLGTQLTDNFKLGNEATEARLMELGRKRLDPLIAQRDEDLRTRLANQGIKAGSDAYAREMNTFNQGTNDAYNQLLLTGRNQANNELLTEDNQRINQISALMSGGQVTMPQFGGTNQPTLPTVDYAGLVDQNYKNQLGQYQSQMAQRQSIMGGLFGLGAAGIMASDRRVKKDIKKVGKLMGHNLYEYHYRGERDDGRRHVGVMAQEAEKKRPDAIREIGGVKHVDYGKLFELGERLAA
ncbi:tail fiber domain-containing protein [Rhizobium rhizogenes]|uniref:tail fiber domain-containing protein n=1 Tax=Rhizobium rhizogenes TaxID=359 RepID=UPI0022CA9AB7|nr:tail fiber domain-containing protein [Rhizobium rhizogenes]MCZ7488542.1 tail fiber domain-containing protein [Rhizobium rhizogenes]